MTDKKKEPENKILHVAVFKACPIGDQKIKDLRITAEQCFDDLPEECKKNFDSRSLMQKDAEKLFQALSLLPQGTLDRLTVLLLDRVKTDLHIGHKVRD